MTAASAGAAFIPGKIVRSQHGAPSTGQQVMNRLIWVGSPRADTEWEHSYILEYVMFWIVLHFGKHNALEYTMIWNMPYFWNIPSFRIRYVMEYATFWNTLQGIPLGLGLKMELSDMPFERPDSNNWAGIPPTELAQVYLLTLLMLAAWHARAHLSIQHYSVYAAAPGDAVCCIRRWRQRYFTAE